jgi:hypothetical protein
VVASLSTLRQRSGSTPHDAVTVDPRLSSHQSVSLALNRQRPHSRQAANFARPRTANVASQGRAAHRSPYSLGKTSAQTPSIQTHQASRRDQIPIVLAASPLHHPPRFRALALFGRRPHQRVDSSINPGDRKPAQSATSRHYSITSSARTSSAGGIVIPSVLAVFRLTTSSSLVGNSMGKFSGLVPFMILSMKAAARRKFSRTLIL